MTTHTHTTTDPAPAPVYESIDCLQLAFDRIKALDAAGLDTRQTVTAYDMAMAQLWTGLATALEVRRLRREWAAREAAWDARR